tara:strand:- start:1187 stop:1342 length:156 start_codon:yes stop_codon:yes gene_type:complete
MKTKLDRIKAMIDREKTRDSEKHKRMVKRAKISDIRRDEDSKASKKTITIE